MVKLVFVLSLLCALPVCASSLDYEQEAHLAAKEARKAYGNGDMKVLTFALERLTVSCNMLALEGAALSKPCAIWFAILKEGCAGSEKEALRACARKFYLKVS